MQYIEESQSLALLETLNHLPEELKLLPAYTKLSSETIDERDRIIKKLRAMADYLAKTHSDVLIADRVGTGVGIGSGFLFIGGLVSAPFTAGLSLGLTAVGTATGILGGITSAGANITGYVISKKSLASLEEELKMHYSNLEKLDSSTSKYLTYAARFRPTMEQLAQLSEQGWLTLLTTFQNMIKHALNAEYHRISEVMNHIVDPRIKRLLRQLPLPFDSETLHALSVVCSQILSHISGIKASVKGVLNYLKKPELTRFAMFYTAGRTTTSTVHEISELSSAFKGTPMAMGKSARVAAGALTAAFIVIDAIHMVRICRETGETPTVQQLRKMADDLESEMKQPSLEVLNGTADEMEISKYN